MPIRKCKRCGFCGDLKFFVKSKKYHLGRMPKCKVCYNKWQAERRKNRQMIPDLSLLVKYGYARNLEEAKIYAGI